LAQQEQNPCSTLTCSKSFTSLVFNLHGSVFYIQQN
jgi:hypothetical protein